MGDDYEVHVYLTKQSPAIAQGVDTGGAGDQGIMIGYATRETENFMPLEYELARKLCRGIYEKYPFDGKTQVTVQGDKVRTVVASFQNTKTAELEKLVRGLIAADEYLINPAGEWTLGGFDADSGFPAGRSSWTTTGRRSASAADRSPARTIRKWTAPAPIWRGASPWTICARIRRKRRARETCLCHREKRSRHGRRRIGRKGNTDKRL